MAFSTLAGSWDLKDALKGVTGGDSGSKIADALGSVLSTDKLDVKQLEGEWKYSEPAVTFKSDNLLKKAGGAAASSVVTSKLAPIYKTVGLDKMILTINENGEFAMKVRSLTLKGTITAIEKEGSQANFEFNFNVGSKPIGKVNAYVEKSVSGAMKLTFDVSKLISLVEKVGSFTGNSTLKTLSSALSSYDGLCAGFELKK
ncbi:MAG: DUF4923 family protein [Bacteroides sp.]|nr:DUF4923 family protein [Bacteroides sp.]MCM1412741.1 DUF4923 family protein [Bacteroides sp.]MCM1470965.1 DUF4923 family protein [Bacteroides sp.]